MLAANPDQPDANHLLGVLLDQTGRGEAGAELIRRALTAAPDNADAHCNLGRVLEGLDQLEAAAGCYETALSKRPDFEQARFNLASVLRRLGRLDESIAAYRRLVAGAPGQAAAHFNLGNALKAAGQIDEAIESYRRALAADDSLVMARVNLGNALRDTGDLTGATDALLGALVRAPDNAVACMSFALLLRGRVVGPGADPALVRQALLACLGRDDLEQQDLATAATSVLLATVPAEVLTAWSELDSRSLAAAAIQSPLADFLADPLLVALASRTIVMEPAVERLLCRLRRSVLLARADGRVGPAGLESMSVWLTPLALQCYRTEYVYAETPAESKAVAELIAEISENSEGVGPIDARWALCACYRPLHELRGAAMTARRDGPSWWAELARVQIEEPLCERALAADVVCFGEIKHDVSAAVRAQYEENPYPRWLGLYDARPAPLLDCLALDVDPVLLADAPRIENPRVLIAGCGTGLHAISSARQYAGAQVLAIDLSRSSLAYGMRRAAELGVENIDFMQGDLLNLAELGRRFDVIESVGVLHHLEDPAAGWRVLNDLLTPGGYMKIGLYSELARRHIVAARALVAELGLQGSLDDIRACRQALLARPEDSLERRVVASDDFYSASGVRDLLLHVQEQRLDLERIAGLIAEFGLQMLGFVLDESVRRAYRAGEPGDATATSLAGWARFEAANPDTFGQMYQFWLRSNPA